jgi:hypothetical protein
MENSLFPNNNMVSIKMNEVASGFYNLIITMESERISLKISVLNK